MLTTLSFTDVKPVVIAVIISSGIVFLLSGIGCGYGCSCLVCISNRFCGGLTWLVGGLSRGVALLGCPVGVSCWGVLSGNLPRFPAHLLGRCKCSLPSEGGAQCVRFAMGVVSPLATLPPWHVCLTREAVTLHGVWVPACWSSRHHGCAIVTATGDCVRPFHVKGRLCALDIRHGALDATGQAPRIRGRGCPLHLAGPEALPKSERHLRMP
jgi:hypothetical protein